MLELTWSEPAQKEVAAKVLVCSTRLCLSEDPGLPEEAVQLHPHWEALAAVVAGWQVHLRIALPACVLRRTYTRYVSQQQPALPTASTTRWVQRHPTARVRVCRRRRRQMPAGG